MAPLPLLKFKKPNKQKNPSCMHGCQLFWMAPVPCYPLNLGGCYMHGYIRLCTLAIMHVIYPKRSDYYPMLRLRKAVLNNLQHPLLRYAGKTRGPCLGPAVLCIVSGLWPRCCALQSWLAVPNSSAILQFLARSCEGMLVLLRLLVWQKLWRVK